MQYFRTTEATDFRPASWRVKVIRSVFWFIPRANPDFERHYPEVRMWYVEADDEGVPQRELGVNATGEPIVAGPWGPNMGFWTDSAVFFPMGKEERISAEAFEEMWSRFKAFCKVSE